MSMYLSNSDVGPTWAEAVEYLEPTDAMPPVVPPAPERLVVDPPHADRTAGADERTHPWRSSSSAGPA